MRWVVTQAGFTMEVRIFVPLCTIFWEKKTPVHAVYIYNLSIVSWAEPQNSFPISSNLHFPKNQGMDLVWQLFYIWTFLHSTLFCNLFFYFMAFPCWSLNLSTFVKLAFGNKHILYWNSLQAHSRPSFRFFGCGHFRRKENTRRSVVFFEGFALPSMIGIEASHSKGHVWLCKVIYKYPRVPNPWFSSGFIVNLGFTRDH